MSNPISDEDLSAIRARCDAATRAPWHTVETEPCAAIAQEHIDLYAPYDEGDQSVGDNVACLVCSAKDAAFIAHARTDVPKLLDEVARLREENAQLW